MKWITFFILIAIWLLVSIFLKTRKPNKEQKEFKYIKSKHPILGVNFLGNEMLFQTITLFVLKLLGPTSSFVYLICAFLSIAALVFHIRDISGAPPQEIFKKLNFSAKDIRDNTFVRITAVIFVASILIAVIVPVVIKYI